ncbi:MAG: hypothetical protein WCP08_00655 [Prolixibacteraceae bacterium]
MKTKLYLTGLALIAITAFASAQDPVVAGQGNGRGRCNGTGKGVAFVDANNDGICDNQSNRSANAAGNKGNGTCNGKGRGQGKGRNFVDANKNGVCDTFEARANK